MIEIRGFTKKFGPFVAVEALSFAIEPGEICGFIGPNGAGKSTTIRFLATLSEPTAGDATVGGFSVTRQRGEVRRIIGYMPEEFGVYDGMRVWEYIDFFGAAFGIAPATRKKVVADVIELVDLTHKRDDYVQALSRGMKQRLCLAKSLVHDPEVLILDEPASGLDPRARVEMKALLKELKRMGKTILISSHILSELADLCDAVAIIERGKLLAHGRIDEIAETMRENRILEIVVTKDSGPLGDLLDSDPDVVSFEEFGGHFEVTYLGDNAAIVGLNRRMIEAGVELISIREIETDLEDMFMNITTGAVN